MTFSNGLNKLTPSKEKYLRAHFPFVKKELNKAIMQRSRLKDNECLNVMKCRNESLKDKTRAARIAYNKQRKLCVSILHKSKKSCYENLDTKYIAHIQKF